MHNSIFHSPNKTLLLTERTLTLTMESSSNGSTNKPFPSIEDIHKTSHGINVLRNGVSSTFGASIVAIAVTPLDVVKVRVQAHVCPVGGSVPCEDPNHVGGSIDAVRKIVRSDGVRGLWRGLNVTLLLAIPTTGIYFTLYEAFCDQLTKQFPDVSRPTTAICAGAAARTATSTACSPLELARTSLQAGVGGPNATVLSVLRDVRQTQGIRAWWRGLGPTLMRDVPFSAIYWSLYERLKDPSRSILPATIFAPGREFLVHTSAGIGAGGLAALCTVPADVIKTRRQAIFASAGTGLRSGSKAASASVVMREIIRADGVRGLFKGAAPRVAKVGAACAIMMGSYEFMRGVLGRA